MQDASRANLRAVVEKELLHYDLLFALDEAGLLDQLTFQGGTALRLCYGAQRYSEDLDFVGGRDFSVARMLAMKQCILQTVGERYGLKVTVKEPKDLLGEPELRAVPVHKWQIRIETSPERADLPQQMIKIEIAAIPAYTRTPQQLRRNYDFLPDGYADLVVLTESLDEIMAHKLISLVNCRSHIRYRDIWDLHWLEQQGASVNSDLVRNKITDYHVVDYVALAADFVGQLPGIVNGADFHAQMSRFTSSAVQERTLGKEKFLAIVSRDVASMIAAAANASSSPR
jgi:predicted nucleotidyltransferase component of viral defense system